MASVCVIGDSHAAALKTGWNFIHGDFPELKLDFFAAMGKYMSQLAVRDGALVPLLDDLRRRIKHTSGGIESIAGTYDYYLICGLGLRAPRAPNVPDDVVLERMRQMAPELLAVQTVKKLRAITSAPIGVIPTPYRSSEAPEAEANRDRAARGIALFGTACEGAFGEFQAELFTQPAETLSDDGAYTNAVFARSPERWYFTQDGEDHTHMDGSFGAIVLRHALNRLLNRSSEERRASSPYEGLPPEAFWRNGVVGHAPDAIPAIYRNKFAIGKETAIATAGSCFSQHLSRLLRARDFAVVDAEPAPEGMDPELARQHQYGIFSARYGNIYTARQLRQIAFEAFGRFEPADAIWEKDRRYYDALRPAVEPDGFATPDEVREARKEHLRAVRRVIETADLFTFTLGMTEAWIHRQSDTTYPTAPGTVAGRYDPATHAFRNFSFTDVYRDLVQFFALAKRANPKIRFLLTVSPVPMTATAAGEHILTASVYSKSVLRAVAGQLASERDDVDYYPGYEIVTSALSKGAYYNENLRTISPEGVAAATAAFLAACARGSEAARISERSEAVQEEPADDDPPCEDVLLDAFS
jgi:hypothetical protein